MAPHVPYVGYLSLGDDPHVVANECGKSGALFFARRNACARCGRRDFTTRRLANAGVLRAFTIVHRAGPGVTVPSASGIVDLDGGGVVKANIVGIDHEPRQPDAWYEAEAHHVPRGSRCGGHRGGRFRV